VPHEHTSLPEVANRCTAPLHSTGVLHLVVFWPIGHGGNLVLASHSHVAFVLHHKRGRSEKKSLHLSFLPFEVRGWSFELELI